MNASGSINIKTTDEIAVMYEAGQILSEIIDRLKCSLKSGMTTLEVDKIAEDEIASRKVRPAFKGYRGFPGCICISVNHEIVHGIPSTKVIRSGDIVSIDVGIIYKDFYSDTAITLGVDDISEENDRLLNVTETSLHKGIEQAVVGARLSDISHAIQNHVEANNLSIVREFVGHGIGRELHEDPEIPNFGPPHKGPELKVGMVFAIEPMVNLGTWQTKILEDGWTVVTKDGKSSAHFEHSIAIQDDGPLILTQFKRS